MARPDSIPSSPPQQEQKLGAENQAEPRFCLEILGPLRPIEPSRLSPEEIRQGYNESLDRLEELLRSEALGFSNDEAETIAKQAQKVADEEYGTVEVPNLTAEQARLLRSYFLNKRVNRFLVADLEEQDADYISVAAGRVVLQDLLAKHELAPSMQNKIPSLKTPAHAAKKEEQPPALPKPPEQAEADKKKIHRFRLQVTAPSPPRLDLNATDYQSVREKKEQELRQALNLSPGADTAHMVNMLVAMMGSQFGYTTSFVRSGTNQEMIDLKKGLETFGFEVSAPEEIPEAGEVIPEANYRLVLQGGLYTAHSKIAYIKALRLETGLSLLSAKELADEQFPLLMAGRSVLIPHVYKGDRVRQVEKAFLEAGVARVESKVVKEIEMPTHEVVLWGFKKGFNNPAEVKKRRPQCVEAITQTLGVDKEEADYMFQVLQLINDNRTSQEIQHKLVLTDPDQARKTLEAVGIEVEIRQLK